MFAACTNQLPGQAPQSAPPAKKVKILIVTGVDYPGHLWRKTWPVLAEALSTPEVQELLRRGVAWAAGLTSVAKAEK